MSDDDNKRRELALIISRLQNKVNDNQRSKILVQLTANKAKSAGGLIDNAYLPLNIMDTPVEVLEGIKTHLEQLIKAKSE